VTDSSNLAASFTINPITTGTTPSTAGLLKVGNYELTTSSLSTGTNFSGAITLVGAPLTVNPLALQLAVAGANKTYDATTNVASTATVSISNKQSGSATDLVNINGDLAFASKAAGTNKQITINNVSITGTDKANYYLASDTLNTTAEISKKQLGAIYQASEKIYDGTTAATVVADLAAAGVISGDTVSVSNTGSVFDSPNVISATDVSGASITGASKVIVSGVALGGADAGNYQLANNNSTTLEIAAGITARKVTLTLTANDKTYDGANTTTGSFGTSLIALTGVSGSGMASNANYVNTTTAPTTEEISFTPGTILLSSKDAGTNITATGGAVLANKTVTYDPNTSDGDSTASASITFFASNYQFVAPTDLIDIAKRQVSATVLAADKEYDGTTQATVSSYSFGTVSGVANSGLVNPETLVLDVANASFANKNVIKVLDQIQDQTVTFSGLSLGDGLNGGLATNYELASTTTTDQAKISPRSITAVTGLVANNKIYDQTTAATINTDFADLTGRIAADALTLNASAGAAAFTDPNAGTGKSLSLNSAALSLSGADAINYVLARQSLHTQPHSNHQSQRDHGSSNLRCNIQNLRWLHSRYCFSSELQCVVHRCWHLRW